MKMLLRNLISILGSSLVGVGVGLCVATGLGADALGVLWEGLAKHLPITVGQASLLVTCTCLLLVLVIDRNELGAATLFNPITTSIFTDWMIRQWTIEGPVIVKFLLVVLGISFIGIGSGIAAATNAGKEGYIALSFALSHRLSVDLAKVRMSLDLICFIAGMVLGGKFMIGPFVGVLLIGPLLKRTSSYCGEKMSPLLG
ncbi:MULTISPECIES: hypothetical protein [unclassified Enterococcus]|uniref:hypothetical protein n=1 Tax=unclassified Enterococcus TaxID=2608891 RepID=UPI000A32DD8C|nr:MULTISPECIES: hypothetical protein [unclassified Enterococcus]OTO65529.1 hypothetical protein A5865_003593 [Enterococcus sp. 12E11_DIV0728]OUZ13395.1 hypothetical protein A5868_003598 [Enterococcus sp. 12F9_DIV0723]